MVSVLSIRPNAKDKVIVNSTSKDILSHQGWGETIFELLKNLKKMQTVTQTLLKYTSSIAVILRMLFFPRT